MPCFGGSSSIQAAQVNNTWYGRAGMEAGKLGGEQVETAEGEVGKMNIDTLRTLQGDTQSWKEVEVEVAEVGNIHSGRGSIRGRHEKVVARIVQEA